MQHVKRVRRTQVSARVTSFGTNVRREDASRQIDKDDQFSAIAGETPINPPYNPAFLAMCVERSNMLKQCIAAMVVNVTAGGQEAVPVKTKVVPDEAEKEILESFVDSCNSEESLSTMLAKAEDDYETYGYAFIEVIRNRRGRLSLLRYLPSASCRLLPKDTENPQLVTYDIARGPGVTRVSEYRSFRRYVQIVGGVYRFFKEFGDQRDMDMTTGQFGKVTRNNMATELIHLRQHSADPYGTPRWINQLPSVLGSRESEECNLRYFEDNTVPPMILSVSGGRLTKQSYSEMRNLLEQQGVGKERQHKILLIEAVPEKEGLDDKGTVQIRIDKLTDSRQSDGLFKEYDEGNQAKVRSSFRLPPVAVGLSQDVTFATARVSAFIAESQVYRPARDAIDEILNKKLINGEQGLNLKTVKLQSRVPSITDAENLIKSLTALNTMGAITPRMANETASRVLQIELPSYPEKGTEGWEEWMDKPILFVTRGVKSQEGQEGKDAETKQREKDGDVGMKKPENGDE